MGRGAHRAWAGKPPLGGSRQGDSWPPAADSSSSALRARSFPRPTLCAGQPSFPPPPSKRGRPSASTSTAPCEEPTARAATLGGEWGATAAATPAMSLSQTHAPARQPISPPSQSPQSQYRHHHHHHLINTMHSCEDESIDEIAAFLGVGDEVAAMTARCARPLECGAAGGFVAVVGFGFGFVAVIVAVVVVAVAAAWLGVGRLGGARCLRPRAARANSFSDSCARTQHPPSPPSVQRDGRLGQV